MKIDNFFRVVEAADIASFKALLIAAEKELDAETKVSADEDDNTDDEVNADPAKRAEIGKQQIRNQQRLLNLLNTSRDKDGATLLHVAALSGSLAMVRDLADHGVVLTRKDKTGKTPLDLAISKKEENFQKIAALLKTRITWAPLAVGFNINRVVGMLDEAFRRIAPAKGREKVILLGPTGVGKSVFFNRQMGAHYLFELLDNIKARAKWVSGAKEIVEVGKGYGSTTLLPFVQGKDNINFVYCDLAGLFESRGHEYKIIATSSAHILSCLEGSIKAVLVFLEPSMFQYRGADGFKQVAEAVYKICGGNPELLKSIYYVFTKTDPLRPVMVEGLNRRYLKPLLKELTQDQAAGLVSPQLFLLRHMIDNPTRIFIDTLSPEIGIKIEHTLNRLTADTHNTLDFRSHDDAQRNFQDFLLDIASWYALKKIDILRGLPGKIGLTDAALLENQRAQENLKAEINRLNKQLGSPLSPAALQEQLSSFREQLKKKEKELVEIKAQLQCYHKEIHDREVILREIDTDERVIAKNHTENFTDGRKQHIFDWTFGAPLDFVRHNWAPQEGNTGSTLIAPPLIPGVTTIDRITGELCYVWENSHPDAKIGRYTRNFFADQGLTSITIDLFCERRHTSENRHRISQLQGEIKEFKARLDKTIATCDLLRIEIARLESLIAASENAKRLRETLQPLIDAAQDALRKLVTEREKLIVECNTLKNELVQAKLEIQVNESLFEVVLEITKALKMQEEQIVEFHKAYANIVPELRHARERLHIPYSALTFGRKLGSGGFGEVFAGKWINTAVAIKVLKSRKPKEKELAEFEIEALRHSEFRNPNIVNLFGVCLDPNKQYCMIIELLSSSLYEALHDARDLPWPIRITIAQNICNGMLFLHSRIPAVIHRDLKSLNVLLDVQNHARISDFGLAKLEGTAITPGRGGTFAWTAPEIFAGEACTLASDIFALAITLWELATRQKPSDDKYYRKPAALDAAIKSPSIPKPLATLIRQCWAPKKEMRLTAHEASEQATRLKL